MTDYLLDLGDGIIYAPATYLARHFDVPAGTLRRWAVEDRWPRRRLRGRCYYLLRSVEHSYARRDTRRRHGA